MNAASASMSIIYKTANRSRNAIRTAIVLTVVFLGTFGLYLYLTQLTNEWQFYLLAIITGIVAFGNLAAIRFGYLGRTELSAWTMIGGIVLLFPIITALLSAVGFALGIGGFIGILMIASLTLVQPQLSRAAIIGAYLGVGVILIDLFIPFDRLSVRFLEIYSSSVAVVAIGIFAYFISREFRNYSLRTKLIVAFVSIAIIVIGTLGYFINRSNSVLLTQDVGEKLMAQSETRALIVGELIAKEVGGLEAFSLGRIVQDRVEAANAGYTGDTSTIQAEIKRLDEEWKAADASNNNNDPLVLRVLNDGISTELREYRDAFPENVEVFVTDQYGANVGSTNRTSDYNQADEDWWQAAYNNGKGAVYIGQPSFDQSSSTNASIIAIPLYAHDTRRVIGVLRTTLTLKSITDVLKTSSLGSTGQVELYLSNGQRISYDGGEFMQGDPNALLLNSDIPSYRQIDYNNIPSLVSRAPVTTLDEDMGPVIKALGWSLIVHQDSQESLSRVTGQTRTIILISLLLLGFAGVIAFYASQIISGPVRSLTVVAERIAGGDIKAKAVVASEDEIGILARSFNRMTDELNQSFTTLEKRISDRTADLERARQLSETRAQELQSISEVSRTISTEQSLNILLPLVARLVSEKFNFYHVGIFLLDDARQFAILQATNSPGGKRMLARGHQLEVGEIGIVGYVAKSGTPRIALDVGLDAVFFNNPDLPETRSEMGLPLSLRGQTIGVLDVQSTQAGAFSENDANTLEILADQVAMAIENARLYGQSQQALEEVQTLYRQNIREGWASFSREEPSIGYHQTITGGKKISKPIETEEIRDAINRGNTLVVQPTGDNQNSFIVVPVKLRGQIIGTLRVEDPKKNRLWSKDEVNLAGAVSDRLSLALENARLMQESQNQVIKEQTISEMTAKIGASNILQNVLQTAVEELGRVMPGSEVRIQFQSAEEN
jgi:GAF domain-containing protein/HAMP domain-containing protein